MYQRLYESEAIQVSVYAAEWINEWETRVKIFRGG